MKTLILALALLGVQQAQTPKQTILVTINYKAEILKKYPKAKVILDGKGHPYEPDMYYISNPGNPPTWLSGLQPTEAKAWQDAYLRSK